MEHWCDPRSDRVAPNVYRINGTDIPYRSLRRAMEVAQGHGDCHAVVLEHNRYWLRHIPVADRRESVVLYPKPGVVTWLKRSI